jgi:hypothetical protein
MALHFSVLPPTRLSTNEGEAQHLRLSHFDCSIVGGSCISISLSEYQRCFSFFTYFMDKQ